MAHSSERMNNDELFLFTVDDLEARLELGQPEYDALMAAWLLRKLLLNGRRSLLAAVADRRGAEVSFRVIDVRPEETIQLWGPEGNLVPQSGEPVRALVLNDFLRWIVIVARLGKARLTVKDLILYLANVAGAVHIGPPQSPKEKVLAEYSGMRRFGPGWQYSGGVSAIREIGEVVLDALGDLREMVRAETWPPGYPDDLKGLGGHGAVTHEDGTIEIVRKDEPRIIFRPDGSMEHVFPDGRVESLRGPRKGPEHPGEEHVVHAG